MSIIALVPFLVIAIHIVAFLAIWIYNGCPATGIFREYGSPICPDCGSRQFAGVDHFCDPVFIIAANGKGN